MGVLDRFSLTGRVALVTGGAGPLFGRSISTALAEAGATLVTASRSRERNDSFAIEMQGRGFDVHGLAFDLLDPGSIDALHDQVLQKFGRLDILVNSALAQQGHRGCFADQTASDLNTVAQGDFAGLFRHCQRAIAAMKQHGRGSIINIASIYGVVSNDPGLYAGTEMVQPPSYNFVKAGMINFTRYLACYYGRDGIRANCISPGGYFNNQPEAFVQRYSDRVPLKRMMGHDDLQGAVVFLASDASAYVTGTNLMVDGGWTCH
ncbi:MAG TPA: SDR family oxidoreductase [Pirellulaceae bacterium]|jgi:NAD(P)-dependent dehydrogenase (short-subunit alcohol dehydrogenase family)